MPDGPEGTPPRCETGGDLIPRATLWFLVSFYGMVILAVLRRPEFLLDVVPLLLLVVLIELRGKG
jgi:hypothetical protein